MNEIKNIFTNILKGSRKCNDLLLDLINNMDENPNYTQVHTVLVLCKDIDFDLAYNVITDIVKQKHSDEYLEELMVILEQNPYIIIGNDQLEQFFDVVEDIILSKTYYSGSCLYEFALCLEKLFAYGFRSLAGYISRLYKILPERKLYSEDYALKRKLACAYEYNGMNHRQLFNKLTEVKEHCKRSKRKNLYGMISYYFAVLYLLSKKDITYKESLQLDKSCQYDYELALILRQHMEV